jgi:hypothetical protein
MRPLTALLTVLLVATLGVWGGAELEKRQGSSTSSSTAASALLSRFRGGAGGSAGGFGAGATAGGGTFGTVTVISGRTLYLTSASGAIVKVKLTPATTYTRNAKSTKTALKPGDTAIVQGTTAKGVTTARSVAATAQGVTSFGGFRGAGSANGASGASN